MRAQGFQNVRIEEFPLVGWERGEESASIVGDHPQNLVVAALGHSPGTNGVIEAEVVRFDSLEALNAAPAGSLAGKIAYIDAGQMVRMQDGAGYGPLTRIRGPVPAPPRPRARSPSSCARSVRTITACRTPAPRAMSRAACRCRASPSARRTPASCRA
jgi:hypothetical protein